ncbi:MAG: malto-oligosyltrehalose synthase [Acidobacteria bacterium]|nr:malto-oligosyltrehalose synthase [Acidobacteriota bacterium]
MRIPAATYRVQFNRGFRFRDARALVPRLKQLGISHLYASPVFQAREGSSHGYDVVDPNRISECLGGAGEFERLLADLRAHDMGIVLDVVPNHMAASPENAWWTDVLENGAASPYASFFGIYWSRAAEERGEKLFLPILGAPFGAVLEKGELHLSYEESGFFISYYTNKLPIGPGTYDYVLTCRPGCVPPHPELRALLESIELLPSRVTTDWELLEARVREKENIKTRLWCLYRNEPDVRELVNANVAYLNGRPGEPRTFDPLEDLLDRQAYRLACWKVATERTNYRRFFDVPEYIGMRVEDPLVFQASHELVLQLVREGKVDGLRVDHIDGLFDPKSYLDMLPHREVYTVVEKILGDHEQLPTDWPVQGTTGYDFLSAVNALFVDPDGLERLSTFYRRFTGTSASLEDVRYERKKHVIDSLFAGEMADLGAHLASLAVADRYARDLSPRALRMGLIEVTACLPVYRTYVNSFAVCERDCAHIRQACDEAARRNADIEPAVYDFLARVLRLKFPPALNDSQRELWRTFVMRWQQLTGPIMAKGFEDAALYVHNLLLSLNEVGSAARPISPGELHEFFLNRQAASPHSMNAGSTHDAKRSEDVRARLNVLSEIPDEFARRAARWSRWNKGRRRLVEANAEYFLFQTLLGAWPLQGPGTDNFRMRIREYLTKAAREARIRTSWLHPDFDYEAACIHLFEAMLDDPRFLADIARLEPRVSFYGAMNSLSQLLLKITAPGVPDFYQGTIAWNLNLVDPDNRRPAQHPGLAAPASPRDLLANWRDGRIKVHVTERALAFRAANISLFRDGDYIPLAGSGKRSENLFTFARRQGPLWAVIMVPRLMTRLSATTRPPVGFRAWRETTVELPAGAPVRWRNVLTGDALLTRADRLYAHRALEHFPVALLAGRVSRE